MSRSAHITCLAVLAAAALTAISTFRDYGMTWDEGVQSEYGSLVLDYYRSGFVDTGASEFRNLRFYGPLFEAGAALLDGGQQQTYIERRHLATALFGLLGVAGVILVASMLRSAPWVAPLAGLALVTMPRFWGHLFANSKDIPFATAFALSMAAVAAWPEPSRRRGLRTATLVIAFGGTAAIRPAGLPLLMAIFGLLLTVHTLQLGRPLADARLWLRQVVGPASAVLAGAWILMVACWPWAHQAPLANPLAAMLQAADFSTAIPVLFDGEVLSSDGLPARYLFQYLLITTPPFVLLLAAAGFCVSVRRQLQAPRALGTFHLALLQAWLLVPLATYLALRPNVYDGVRHFLFVLAPVALFAALGLHALLTRMRPGRPRQAAVVLAAAVLLWPVQHLVRLHPYQAAYFNAFVGGLAGAEGRYETDYWASSYREAMQWLNQRSAERGGLRVVVAANAWSLPCAETYADEGIRLEALFGRAVNERLPEEVDYYLSTYRYGLDGNFPETPVVHRIGRSGAVFAVIRGHTAPK